MSSISPRYHTWIHPIREIHVPERTMRVRTDVSLLLGFTVVSRCILSKIANRIPGTACFDGIGLAQRSPHALRYCAERLPTICH